MPLITLDIPAQQMARCVDALCAAAGLPPTPANAKAALVQYVTATVRNVERGRAEADARKAVVVPSGVTPT